MLQAAVPSRCLGAECVWYACRVARPRYAPRTQDRRATGPAGASGRARLSLATIASLAACSGEAARVPAPSAAPLASTCDLAAAGELEARGELDAELARLTGCDAATPEALARRIAVLLELGEIEAAKAAARTVPASAPPSLRAVAADALSRSEAAADELAGHAREAVRRGLAAERPADARRAFSRARHLFERASGAPGRLVDVQLEGGVRWVGDRPVFAARLAGERVFVVPELDRAAQRLRPELALPSDGVSDVVAWPGRDGFFVAGPRGGALVESSRRAGFSLPRGQAVFSRDGGIVVIATDGNLAGFSTADGARLFEVAGLGATGRGRFLGAAGPYAELGDATTSFVVDRGGKVLFAERDVPASAASDAYLAVLRPQGADGGVAKLSVETRPLDRLDGSKVRATTVTSPMDVARFDLRFEGPTLVVTARSLSALRTEGTTYTLAEIDVASGAKVSRRAREPASRADLFAALAARAKAALQAPRAAVDFWLHSQTFDRDLRSRVDAIVTGVPVRGGAPSSVDAPSLLFLDAGGRVLADVPLTSGRAVIANVSLAPGGEAAVVVAQDASWLVDRVRGIAVKVSLPRDHDLAPLWSSAGAFFLGAREIVDVRASDAARGAATRPLAFVGGAAALAAACWFPPWLAPADVCR